MIKHNRISTQELLSQLGFPDVDRIIEQYNRLSDDEQTLFSIDLDADEAVDPVLRTSLRFTLHPSRRYYELTSFECSLHFREAPAKNRSHLFDVSRESFTYKEACNLLSGRAVFEPRPTRQSPTAGNWVELNFSLAPRLGRYPYREYRSSSFDIETALDRLPVLEKNDPAARSQLLALLKEGTPCWASFVRKSTTDRKLLEASPHQKCIVIRPATATVATKE